MATRKPTPKAADDACQAKTGTVEQQDPVGKDKGQVPEPKADEDESE